jgi:hypothetical protein
MEKKKLEELVLKSASFALLKEKFPNRKNAMEMDR